MWFTAQKLSSHQPMGTVVSKAHRSFTIASSFVQIYKLSMSTLLWSTLDWPVFNSMRSCSNLNTRTPYLVGSNFICSQFHRYFCLIKTYFGRHAAIAFLLNTKQSRGTRLPFMVVIRHTIHQSWNKLAIALCFASQTSCTNMSTIRSLRLLRIVKQPPRLTLLLSLWPDQNRHGDDIQLPMIPIYNWVHTSVATLVLLTFPKGHSSPFHGKTMNIWNDVYNSSLAKLLIFTSNSFNATLCRMSYSLHVLTAFIPKIWPLYKV